MSLPQPQFINANSVRLAVYRWTRPRAPRLVLIHGYPDNATMWRTCARELARDFDVTAYDVRGAGRSDHPPADTDYTLELLMQDLLAVIDAVSPDQPAHLVGHDWGSLQGWEAVCDPQLAPRIATYTSLSGPCLDHVGAWLRRGLTAPRPSEIHALARQAMHSWYIGVFQLPRFLHRLHHLAGYRGWFARQQRLEGVRTSAPGPEQVRDGQAGIRLYRANMLPRVLRPNPRPTTVPVQVLMPRNDPFMIPAIWSGLNHWVSTLWYQEMDTGHWSPLSHPLTVASHIRELVQWHLSGRSTPRLEQARRAARTL